MNLALPHIKRLYKRFTAFIQGPSQGVSIKCGSYTATHFVYAQSKNYLESIIQKAATQIRFPCENFLEPNPHLPKTPTVIPKICKLPNLFKDEDVSNVMPTILMYASDWMKEHDDQLKEAAAEVQKRRFENEKDGEGSIVSILKTDHFEVLRPRYINKKYYNFDSDLPKDIKF